MSWVLIRKNDGVRVYLSPGIIYSLGCGVGNIILCNSRYASDKHCSVEFIKGKIYLVDLLSLNGTYVNGRRIEAGDTVILKENYVIGVGTPAFFDNDCTLFTVGVEGNQSSEVRNTVIGDGNRKRKLQEPINVDLVPEKAFCVEDTSSYTSPFYGYDQSSEILNTLINYESRKRKSHEPIPYYNIPRKVFCIDENVTSSSSSQHTLISSPSDRNMSAHAQNNEENCNYTVNLAVRPLD